VDARSRVRQRPREEFGWKLAGNVSGLWISDPGWPQTCARGPGAVLKPPSVFWLSQAERCTPCACSASASSRGTSIPVRCHGAARARNKSMLILCSRAMFA